MYLAPDHRSVYYNLTEREQEAQDKIIKDNRFEPLDPVLNFTDDEIATIAEIQVSLEKSAQEFNARYILDKSLGSQWEDWKNNAVKLGTTKLIDIFNEAQKRFDAAK